MKSVRFQWIFTTRKPLHRSGAGAPPGQEQRPAAKTGTKVAAIVHPPLEYRLINLTEGLVYVHLDVCAQRATRQNSDTQQLAGRRMGNGEQLLMASSSVIDQF
jgi:hypothetical protein